MDLAGPVGEFDSGTIRHWRNLARKGRTRKPT